MTFCSICCSEVPNLRASPTTCSKRHGQAQRACNECWKAHLSLEVETKDPRSIECMFCRCIIGGPTLRSLARDGTKHRYDLKLQGMTRHFCHTRCPASKTHGLQNHDRTTQGRVFTCQFCSFRTCLDCDRSEHVGETCSEYKTRVMFNPKNVKDEAATKAKYHMCPECDSVIEIEKGCGYTMCNCGYRFCSRPECLIPWVGEDSAYLGGKAAHWEGCKYRTRDGDSVHTLQRRFQQDDETVARELERKAENAEKNAKRKLDKILAEGPESTKSAKSGG